MRRASYIGPIDQWRTQGWARWATRPETNFGDILEVRGTNKWVERKGEGKRKKRKGWKRKEGRDREGKESERGGERERKGEEGKERKERGEREIV